MEVAGRDPLARWPATERGLGWCCCTEPVGVDSVFRVPPTFAPTANFDQPSCGLHLAEMPLNVMD
ncbi:MAG TPA: hypothetical protein DEF32_20315 [Hydrogenophaga sp.]|nr:hypothetical protein [Hydrogenophaga sp.]